LGNPGGGKGNFTAPIGLVLLLTGFLLLTAPMWAAPEHVVDGVNYVLVLEVPLVVNGAAMMIGGAVLVIARRLLTLRTRAMGNQ
jgi:nitrate reductase gamma subunit